jgi:hypothetical protein
MLYLIRHHVHIFHSTSLHSNCGYSITCLKHTTVENNSNTTALKEVISNEPVVT